MSKVFYLFSVASFVQTSAGYMIADEHVNEKVLFTTFKRANAHLFRQLDAKNTISKVPIWQIYDLGRGVAVCELWSVDKCVYLRFSVAPIELLR